MSNSELSSVGDHFLIGLRPTTRLHELDRALLADLRPAGVILYRSNFFHDQPYDQWLDAHATLLADIRSAVRRERLVIAIDHEGGRVCRTPSPITRFSYAAKWGNRAGAIGRAMGRELASLGVNLNFAPVLDIHSNPDNPVIGERAFARTGEEVAAAALQFMSAMQGEGVLACGKHFPGHGDTDKDSHRELPTIRGNLDSLRERELKPFIAAIEAEIPMMMTSHIFAPAVDPLNPVTLSRPFNQQLLREELGYTGVVVTDDIGMRAVSAIFSDPTAAVELLLAGADMLMICSYWTDTDRSRGLAQALVAAQKCGALPAAVLDPSRQRIQHFLAQVPQNGVTSLPAHVFQRHRLAGPLFSAEIAEVI
jgi:beta-N-acetylhexosaminidase